ncbi:PREDICTED: uncharacterized protein LOC104791476 isoform X1 [Camelina sativa]|uniref:Uncharacterized protein LOC104791476 isoform X1 n=1 Tax=Camelina sativa TaxID=90675 RepID=A0ABM0ZH66_CAMSA|nr:PREDICTED: uncharacterized protein LOC104791476 isoform X1 [Camelina sativa]
MAHQDNFVHHHHIRSIDSDARDPTLVTIEFLRARLLAERAVSKSARAKLDGLADKVAELEEQLKIVSLQRKKAEQATAEVLAILEENGYTDVSDDYDGSNSDHECYSQTNSVFGKSLSWKGRRREPASFDKIKENRNRRHLRGFESPYFSSPRHRQGRSCRQIRRSESRIASEDYKRDGNSVDFQENGVRTDVLPQTSEEASQTVVDVTAVKGDESLNKLSNSNGLDKDNSMDINLERALENRAQVIGSFEDMEETQREWETKFREKKSSALDLCDVGNHSDVTDESNGEMAQAQLQDSMVVPSLRDTRSIANEVDFREPSETLSHGSPDNSVTSPDKCCKSCGSRSVEQDAYPSGDKGKQISESPKSEYSRSQSSKGINEHSSSTIRSPPVTQPNSRGGSFYSTTTTIQKVEYPLVPRKEEKADTCETVLTALKQAKLSLQEKVNSLHIRKPESSYPSTPGSYTNTYTLPIEPAFSTKPSLPASMLEFPVDCAGLFRVPTVIPSDASNRNNFLASSSQKAFVTHMPERDIALVPGNLLNAGFQSQVDTSPPLSVDDRLLTTPYIGGPKLWSSFRADGPPMVDVPGFRLYKGTPRVSGGAISGGTSGFEGNQVSSTSFSLDRRASIYTPVNPSRSLYPDSVQSSRELYSTPYYTRPIGLPPTGGSDDGLFRRV